MKTRLRLPLFTFLLTVLCFGFSTEVSGQIISQYIETDSGTTPKGVEIWNNTASTLDFSVNTLELHQGTNGGALSLLKSIDTGTLESGDVLVIGTVNIGDYLINQGLSEVVFINESLAFNGDDALAVIYGGTTTDVFGTPDVDPGTHWGGNGVETKDQNIALLPGVVTGSEGFEDPSTRFETISTTPSTLPAGLSGFGTAPLATSSPVLSTSISTISDLNYIFENGPSDAQSFVLTGENLDGTDVSLLADGTVFEISENETSGYTDLITLNAYDGTDKTIWVRTAAGLAAGDYNDILIIDGGGATDIEVAVSGTVQTQALDASVATLTGLNYMFEEGPSAAQNFEVSGTLLDGSQNVSIEILMGAFEISLDNVTYSENVTLTNYNGAVETVYVRLKSGQVEAAYNDFITIEGYGLDAVEIELFGEVTPFIDQYTGVGVFELINAEAEITPGYYVVANETSEFLMTNENSSDYFESGNLTLVSGTVVNADVNNVWYIDANASLYTIYNEVIEKYVAWYSGNTSVGDDNVSANSQWTFTYQDDKFTVNNVQTTERQLSYNNSFSRFAAYGNDGQHQLQLYKLVESVPEPTLLVTPTTVSGLDYQLDNGPSPTQAIEVSGLSLDGTDVTIGLDLTSNFEISTDEVSFSNEVSLPSFDGTETTIYVRLKTGLTENTYTDTATINGGGADLVNVVLNGAVTPNFDGIETFENFTVSGSSYTDGEFLGVNGNTWNFVDARGDIDITDETVTLRNTLTASLNTYMTGGLTSFSFDYMQAFSTDVNLDVFVDGVLVTTVTSSGEQSQVKNSGLIVLDTPVLGIFNIEFKQNTAIGGQVAIDNLSWVGSGVPNGTYTYENGSWFPVSPLGIATPVDNIVIVNGTAVFDQNITMNNLYILPDATLEVEDVIHIDGDLSNEGTLIFKSSATNTAQLDTFSGINLGEVEVQRYIPARRAFRFLSSAVTTSGTINANWQEGAVNATDNPNPTYGTHITGSVSGENGFDATPSGNPSLFTLNNTGQSWEDVENTDVNTIAAGTPYRMLVRGDRSIDVSLNDATATNTTLRTTGVLHTGTFTTTDLSEVENEFNFFGNPYPAAVDMNDVVAASTNVNNAFYYIWDPNLGTRGAYVTIDLPAGTNSSSSAANQYLQPGQAAFVTTQANGAATLQFEETHKSVDQPLTGVFNVESNIDLRLYSAEAFGIESKPADGLRLKFADSNSNNITTADAPKFYNQDENLASTNDERLWSIESRALPVAGESISLFTNQYRTTDYVFEAELTDISDVTAILRDHYTGTDTALTNNETSIYAFNVDSSDPNSSAEDRFEIVFEELLSTNDVVFGNGFVVFPNPTTDTFTIATKGISGDKVSIHITNVLGQTVYNNALEVNNNGQVSIDATGLSQGIYTVNLIHNNGGQFTSKLVKK